MQKNYESLRNRIVKAFGKAPADKTLSTAFMRTMQLSFSSVVPLASTC